MNIKKVGVKLPFTFEMLLDAPDQKHHYEPAPPLTDEQRAERKRAKAALKELERNPWVVWPHMEGDIEIRPIPTRVFVADETTEEWLKRREAWIAEQS